MALSSPSWRILPWTRSSSTLSLLRALSARGLGRLVGLLGPLRRALGLDLELQGAPGQLLVALLQRLFGLPLEVLDAAVLGVLLALGLRLERDGGGGGLAQAAQVVEHLPHRLLEHGEGHLALGLAQDGVEDGLEEPADAGEHGGLRGEGRSSPSLKFRGG